ncbi:ATP-binding protein [Sinobacterium caligoides]|uniref:ATP-binding protein n=1 Tax=Sinobacterium caligoides TaxID=933926 RepID=UPI0013C3483F|nr:ATP-binding protein [Sinobacterium caligoides]
MKLLEEIVDSSAIVAEIGSEYCYVKELFIALNDYLAVHCFLPEQLAKLELCIAEVANNSIRHAYQLQSGQPIWLAAKVEQHRLNIQVIDRGMSLPWWRLSQQLDWEQVQVENPDSWAVDGRGLQIVRDLMDEVSYDSIEGNNIFTMTMRR